MEIGTLIGLGVGFGLVGIIFTVLGFRRPDLPFFKRDSDPKSFYRKQGAMGICAAYGVLTVLVGVMYLLLPETAKDAPSHMFGLGFMLLLTFGVLAILTYRNPPVGPFKKYERHKLWQIQGELLMQAGFGVIFLVIGLMGKPWAA